MDAKYAYYYYEGTFKIAAIILGSILALTILLYYGLSGPQTYLEYRYILQDNTESGLLDAGYLDRTFNTLPLDYVIQNEVSEAYMAVNITNGNESEAQIISLINLVSGDPSPQYIDAGETELLTYGIIDESIFSGDTMLIRVLCNRENVTLNSVYLYYPYASYDASSEKLSSVAAMSILIIIVIYFFGRLARLTRRS